MTIADAPVRGRLTDALIKELTSRLDQHLYRAGERLPSEHELCKEFGVSRTVVREAVASIRLSGRVVSKPGIGLYVAEDNEAPIDIKVDTIVDSRAALHIMELRMGLEVEAAGLAAERRTPQDLADIVKALDDFKTAPDAETAAKADFAFHLAIARASHNPHFAHLLESAVKEVMLDLLLKRVGKIDDERRAYEQRSSDEHGAILVAIMRNDPGTARAAMLQHLGDSIRRYRKLLGL